MSKLLPASCLAGVVRVGGLPVPAVDILSEGAGASEGVLALDSENSYYITSSAQDLKSTLDKLVQALDKAVLALNSAAQALTLHDTAGYLIAATAGVPSPPLAASQISSVSSNASLVSSLTAELTVLKESLK